jgi:hypothetical protein
MIERTMPATPRVRAGVQSHPIDKVGQEPSRNWIHDRAPRLGGFVRERQRREQVWAWLSLVTLIICWDASERLGERVSPPRTRIAHALDDEEVMRAGSVSGFSVEL